MNILILNYEFPPLGGGAGNATKNISKELVKLGHQVIVITTWFKDLPDEENVDGYKVIRLHSKRARKDRSNTLEMLHYVILAKRYTKRLVLVNKPDHIISFFALPTGLVAWYLNKKFKIPYTLSLRGGDVPGFLPKNLKRLHMLTMPFTNMIWKKAAHIVANSIGLKQLAEKTASHFNKKVECIPNGVDTDIFKPNQNQGKSNNFEVLFVGRLTEQKGATYLLKALAKMSGDKLEVVNTIHCTIIGDGPLRKTLESEAAELGIADRVSFIGWVDRDELPKYYQSSDVFVLPTSEEGMPNVVLEAMASGLPIITTNVAGNEELVHNSQNGILINNLRELSTAILELCNDRDKAGRYGQESRKLALQMGWNKIAEEYANLCK